MRRIPACLLAIAIVFPATAAAAQFALPEPTGPYPVGLITIALEDPARRDPFRADAAIPRALAVTAYYPADPDGTEAEALYFGGDGALLRASIGFFGLPDAPFAPLAAAPVHARIGPPLADAAEHYPVVLFSHGAGTNSEMHTTTAVDLASHGYVVLAIDHPYAAGAVRLPGGIVTAAEATRMFDVAEPAAEIVPLLADDVRFVLSELERTDGGIDPRLAGRLDLDAVAAMGHSVGGAVAWHLAVTEPRIRAAIDLDGLPFTPPPADPAAVAPILVIAADTLTAPAIAARSALRFPPPETLPAADRDSLFAMAGGEPAYRAAHAAEAAAIDALADAVAAAGTLFAVTGSDHMKFADIGLYAALPDIAAMLPIGGDTAAAEVLAAANALAIAFLDEQLRGAEGRIAAVLAATPELRRIDVAR